MDSIDYLITAHGVIERGLFYNYMHDLGFKDNSNELTIFSKIATTIIPTININIFILNYILTRFK